MTDLLNETEANRRISFSIGFLDICQRKHLDALVLTQLFDNLARARRSEHVWELRDNKVFVEATYARWWQELRLGRKAAYRVLQRLDKLELIERRTCKRTGGGTALFVHVREQTLSQAWLAVQEGGLFDPPPQE
jgi:hypothetical protein